MNDVLQPPNHFPYFQEEALVNRGRLIFYNKYWTFSAKLFLILTVLFYELALFNHVFAILSRTPYRNIQDLSKDEMGRFVLVRNSGYEGYFRLAADPRREYENADDNGIPWKRVSTDTDAYNSILANQTFSVSYGRSLILQMKRSQSCDKLTFYETDAKRSYNGGWFYSKNIPEQMRTTIDKSLSQLVEEGRADELLHCEEESAWKTCGRGEPRVNVMLLLLPLLPVSLFIIIGIFIIIMYHHIKAAWRRNANKN